jgi:hypothetical protein
MTEWQNRLARKAAGADARLSRCRGAGAVEAQLAPSIRRWSLPARRGAQAPRWPRRRGRGVPAAGRRLRRKLRPVQRRQHPRHLQGDAADGDGADLRRQGAGGQGGPHGRPVRQAALGADRGDRRVELPSYRGDIINGFAFTPEARIPTPQRMLQAYTAGRGHAEPAARLLDRRLCRHAPGAFSWTLGFTDATKADATASSPTASRTRSTSWRRRASTARRRTTRCKTVDFYTSHEALLLEYEEALTGSIRHRLAGGVGPHDLDRRPHAPARRRACRILPRRAEPDRAEMRPQR